MKKSEQKRRLTSKWQVLLIASLAFLLVLSSCTKEPDVEQIKADLLGREMFHPGEGLFGGLVTVPWKFASISEFLDVKIRSKQKQGDRVIEYDISMRLQDMNTKNQYLADVVVLYKKVENKWEFSSVPPKLWKALD